MKKRNPLLEPEEIGKRLKALENGFASNAIEGNPLPQEEKDFLIDLVKQGKTGDEIVLELDKYGSH